MMYQTLIDTISPESLTVADVLGAIAVLLASYIFARMAKRWVATLLDANADVSEALTDPISRLASWLVMLLGVVIALSMLGVGMGPAVLLFGILVLLGGVAGKGLLENFTAGLAIHFSRPFVVGDRIETHGIVGWVEAINSHAVVLRTPDGRRVLVPNREVQESVLVNYTATDRRRSEFAFSVALGEDLDEVRDRAIAAAQGVDEVREHPAPELLVVAVNDGVDVLLRYFHPDDDRRAIRSRVAQAVLSALQDAEIELTTPQLEVSVVGGVELQPDDIEVARRGSRSGNSRAASSG
jgi:small conductance mechanosensitive channel